MSVKAKVDTRRATASLTALEHELDPVTQTALRNLGGGMKDVYGRVAPHRTGNLGRSIHMQPTAGRVLVRAEARDPQTRFDYTAITRFGRHGFKRKRKRALRFVMGGRVVFRQAVGPYRPAGDWADRAYPEVVRRTQDAAERVARELGAFR